MTQTRSFVSTLVAMMLLATAVTAAWLMISAGVFAAAFAGNPEFQALAAPPNAIAAGGEITLTRSFQPSQPRDPFKPLVETTTTIPPATTTTTDGSSTTTTTGGQGSTTTTQAPGSTTTTTQGTGSTTTTTTTTTTSSTSSTTTTTMGNQPSGIRVVLVEIREVSGVKRATLTVDGTTFTVGVGDTFATNFKVVSLSDDSGVFMFGDNAFTLAVGQAILK